MSITPEKEREAGGSIARLLGRISPRARSVLAGVASIAVLALVILGVSALSAPKSNRPLDTNLSAVNDSDSIYGQALSALESGETTLAVTLLEKALELDPDNQRARSTLETVRRTRRAPGGAAAPSDDTADDGDTPPAPDDDPTNDGDGPPVITPDDPAFENEIDDLGKLLPEEAEGYALGTQTVVEGDATVSGSPNQPDLAASRAVWTVHDRKTPQSAKVFIERVSKSLHPQDAQSVVVDGVSGYFGTDGTRFATIAFVRGRYVFEVVLTSLDGKPAALRGETEKAASAFPDKL